MTKSGAGEGAARLSLMELQWSAEYIRIAARGVNADGKRTGFSGPFLAHWRATRPYATGESLTGERSVSTI
jgi:hypothetical protein